jgi:hypothetical protein
MLGLQTIHGKGPVLFERHDEPSIGLVGSRRSPSNVISETTDANVPFRTEECRKAPFKFESEPA